MRADLSCSKVNNVERGNPMPPPGRNVRAGVTARRAVGVMGIRGRKKQMPVCNGPDRSCNMLSTETMSSRSREACAHVRQVFRRERVR